MEGMNTSSIIMRDDALSEDMIRAVEAIRNSDFVLRNSIAGQLARRSAYEDII